MSNQKNNNKNSDHLYCVSVVFLGLIFFLSSIVSILFFQTRCFYKKVQTMAILQEEYRSYCKNVKEKKDLEIDFVSDEVDKNQRYWGIRGNGFIVVDRDLGYLKKSMISHLKNIRREDLLSQINMRDWEDYSGTLFIASHKIGTKQIGTKIGNKTGAKINNRTNKPTHKRINNKASTVYNKKLRHINRPINRAINQNGEQAKRTQQVKRSPASSFFIWPIDRDKFWLSSFFGTLRKKANGSWYRHPGIDMAANKGTAVKAVAAGAVSESRYASGYGNMILLHHGTVHGNTYETRFAHLDKIFVKRGEQVQKGQVIGTVGDTGFIRKRGKDGSHLHFEVYMYDKRINPLVILPVLV